MNKMVLIESDANKILEDALHFHKKITGEDLPLCHEKTYLYSTVAALLANIKAQMNDVALQNFLKFSRDERIDLKGAFYGSRGARLQANKSRTTIRCYISSVVAKDVIIPKGTRFIYKKYLFYIEKEYKIAQGKTYVDVIAVSETAGTLEKILIGEITEIVDRYEYFERVENITEVTGGREIENDEEYKKRLELIPESFTSGGSQGAYEYWAKKASPLVTDVFINSPSPNYIDIYVVNGIETISSEEREKIKNFIILDEDIKVLNDQIQIKDPEIHNYNININYWIYDDSIVSQSVIEQELTEALERYSKNFKMGESINLQDIIETSKKIEGIKRIEIISPDEFKGKPYYLPKCGNISVSYRGSEQR